MRGVVAARASCAPAPHDVSLGFTFAYRYMPSADASFWSSLGQTATPAFRRALGHVGFQLYPGLFWPPVLLPGQSAGDATAEALTLLRDCWMPMAQLGAGVPIWITENGYATNLGHDEARQATDCSTALPCTRSTDARRHRLPLLQPARQPPNGTDLFDDVGLLRADYSRKPAFAALRSAIVSCFSRRRSACGRSS